MTRTEEWELYINRPGVPYWVGERALAAAQVVFDQAGVEARDACYACDKREGWEFEADGTAVPEFTRRDKQLVELWERASEAANAVLRSEGLLTGEVDWDRYLAMRRVLGEADRIARAAWMEEAMAEFARHGYEPKAAYYEAQNDWLLLTNVESDIAPALAINPEALARRTIEWKTGSGGIAPAVEVRRTMKC